MGCFIRDGEQGKRVRFPHDRVTVKKLLINFKSGRLPQIHLPVKMFRVKNIAGKLGEFTQRLVFLVDDVDAKSRAFFDL